MEAHRNPFRVERIEALGYRAPGLTAAALCERLRAMGGRGALVGAKGRGKTTLIEAMGVQLEREGLQVLWVRLSRERRSVDWRSVRRGVRPAAAAVALLVDGAEQLGTLGWWRLRRLARRAAVLLVTSHRPGLLPTLHRHESTPGLLHELVEELLAGTGLPSPPPAELAALHRRHGGNLRDCLRALYDRHAGPSPDTTRR